MCVCVCNTYIYIYIYIYTHDPWPCPVSATANSRIGSGRNRFDSIHFGSDSLVRFASLRFASEQNNLPGSTRSGMRFSDVSWLAPVRFGSVPRPVPAGFEISRFGLVRFGWFGPVSHSFLCE